MKKTRMITLLALMLTTVGSWAYDAQQDSKLTGSFLSSSNASQAQKAFDGDAMTYYRAVLPDMQYVGLDLGSPHVITRIQYTCCDSYSGPDHMLLSVLEGANSPDFMDAMPLYLISEAPKAGVATTVDVNVSRGFRYVRYVGASGSYCDIAELAFYGHEGEGDDSKFYQVTQLPTMSIHVQGNNVPTNRGEDFEAHSTLIYEDGKLVQEYPVLVRVRGNYSTVPDNKPYRIKFNDGKSHHMMKGSSTNESPVKAKKWVLLNSWRDKTLMRNNVAWYNSKLAGPKFTPWNQPIDLIVNGDYRGTYTLADHIDVHEGRIDITEMTADDTEGEALTGGYYVEVDNNAGREKYNFNTNYGNTISVHDPDEDVMQPVQFNYIRNKFNEMEGRVFGSSYTDQEKGYRSMLDLESFLDYFLISEFNGNTDMLCQVFMYKERGDDHFYTGPVWDHDLALDDDSSVFPTNGRQDWIFPHRCTGQWSTFVGRVLSDPSAMLRLQEKWAQLRDNGNITVEKVVAGVDSLRNVMRASSKLNFIRWPYFNQWLSLTVAIRNSWDEEVDVVRDYVEGRVAWMDRKLSYNTLATKDGAYQIGTPHELCLFSQMVAGGETSASAVLTADIDMTDYSARFIPIGTSVAPFIGTLDGKGHTIRHLHITGTDNVGLFSHVADGMTVKRLMVDASCTFEGENNVAAFIANAGVGVVNVNSCGSAATVKASGKNAAALIAGTGSLTTLVLTNCYNVGNVTAMSMAAALAAPSPGSVSAACCYNTGLVTATVDGKEFAFGANSCTINSCYDLYAHQVSPITEWQIHSGELCYILNTAPDSNGMNVWRQNIDNGRQRDEYPVLLTTSGKVLFDGDTYTNINRAFTGYRYYRLHVTELKGGLSGGLQISEFDILDETGNDVVDLRVLAGPSGFEGEGWENIADNNVSSKFCGRFNDQLNFFFDAQDVIRLTGYRMYTAGDTQNYPDRNPISWILYGCNDYTLDADDSRWETIDERTNDNTMGATNNTPYDFLVKGTQIIPNEPTEPYHIATPLQLIDFANAVNHGETEAEAYLDADIDMTGYSDTYKPIGTQQCPYHGTFDGQGHSVRLDIVASTDYQGMFGFIDDGVHIKNLVTKGSVISTAGRMAGIAAQAQGKTGIVRFTNCGNEARVEGNNNRAAGILGNNWGGYMTVVMENVYNTGDISCNTNAAGICGHLGNSTSTLVNCYNAGNISAPTSASLAITPAGSFINCYTTTTFGDNADVQEITEEMLRSGELCYHLNVGRTDDVVWHQHIGEEDFPVFTPGSGIVYATNGGAPYFNSQDFQQIDFVQGWNWTSHSMAAPVGLDDINTCISIVRSQTEEAFLDEAYGWVGNVTTLQPLTAYKIWSEVGGSVMLSGLRYDGSEPQLLHKGWNWIGVPVTTDIADDELALVGYKCSEGDRLVGREGFLSFGDGNFTGNLWTLQPGHGYMFYTQQEQTLQWTSLARRAESTKMETRARRAASVSMSAGLYASQIYPNVMNAIITADGIQDGSEVRVYAGNECRAHGLVHEGLCFLTIFGEGGEILTFHVSDGSIGLKADQVAAFNSLDLLGSSSSPYVLTFEEATGIETAPAAEESGSASYFSIDGRKISRPGKGIYLRRSVMADGTSRIQKVARK